MAAVACRIDRNVFEPGGVGYVVRVVLPDGATVNVPPLPPKFGFGGTIEERLAAAGWGVTGKWEATEFEGVLQVGVEPQPNARENRALLVQHRA